MKTATGRTRILDPLERFSEIVFGLVMVLTFTCAISVAEAGREDVRKMLIGALGCNLAWGIIGAALYLISCLTERRRNAALLREVQRAATPAVGQKLIAEALPPVVAEALQSADFNRIGKHIQQLPEPGKLPGLSPENWRGAAGIFCPVFLFTLPVITHFTLMQDAPLALRISNGIAIAMLFGAGSMLAGYGGMRRIPTALAMVAIGAALVGLAVALGG